ncbi:MAG: hypothetical protein H0U53_05975 [Actinobacteria bacterium]|nr:hypothetical protein [Actinomycetota bacterium]
MDRDEITHQIQELQPEFAKIMRSYGAHEPDWGPLERVLPYEECGGFMFMGYVGEIRMYKHGFTRRYLNLDPQGNAYGYLAKTNNYIKIPLELAIDEVFATLKHLGVERTTPFSEEEQLKRRKAMEAAGWTVISMTPEG